MTVRELIARLIELEPEREVVISEVRWGDTEEEPVTTATERPSMYDPSKAVVFLGTRD